MNDDEGINWVIGFGNEEKKVNIGDGLKFEFKIYVFNLVIDWIRVD